MIYLEAIAEELVVEELVDDQDLAEDDEEVGGLAGVEQHRIAVILVVEMLLRFTEIIREPVKKSVEKNFQLFQTMLSVVRPPLEKLCMI